MPWAHRWIGNPVLTFILNVFFGVRVSDAHCGMRAIRRSAVAELDLQATGMEFASEMILKASKREPHGRRDPDRLPAADRRVEAEHLAGRLAPPALHAHPQLDVPLPDPGAALLLLGLAIMLPLAGGPVTRLRAHLVHPRDDRGLAWRRSSAAQIVQLGLFARTYAMLYLNERDPYARAALGARSARARPAAGRLVAARRFGAGIIVGDLRRVGRRRLRRALRGCTSRSSA